MFCTKCMSSVYEVGNDISADDEHLYEEFQYQCEPMECNSKSDCVEECKINY